MYNISQLPITLKSLLINPNRLILLGLLMLSGIVVWGQTPAPAQGSPAADAPKPVGSNATAQPVDPKTYVIGVGDELKIEVFREAELTRNVIVRIDGKITMPILNDIQAEGLTPERLQKQLTDGFTGGLIATPVVTVSVLALNSKRYYINGMVNHPGSFFLTTPITIFDALNGAGGFQPFANLKKIVIVRGTKRINFNYKAYLDGKNPNGNIFLESGDTVYVN